MTRTKKNSINTFSISNTMLKGVFLLSALVISIQGINAISIGSFDTFLQNQYVGAKQGLGLKDLPDTAAKGNIFNQALRAVDEKSTVSIVETINYTTKALNSLNFARNNEDVGACNLQASDTISLLYMIPSIKSDLNKETGTSSRDAQDVYDNFRQACSKLYACYNNEAITERKQLTYCKNVAADAYYMGKINSSHQNSLDSVNYGDNIFADNRLDNSSFDVMVDIKRIGDILFEGNKEPSEILFFKFPTVDLPAGSDDGFGPASSGLGFGQSSLLPGGGPGSGGSLSGATGSGNNILGSVGNNPSVAGINDFINQTNETNPVPASNNTSLISNHVCIVPDTIDGVESEAEVTAQQIDDQLTQIFNNYTNLLNDQGNPSPISAQFTSGDGGGIANDIDSQRAIEDAQRKRACSLECESQIDPDASQFAQEFQQSICEADCCIQKCEPLGPFDKVICTTDCLCDEISSENNTFKIKFCKIPVKSESPVPKKVQSVEEILNELSNVIKYLQQQGEPIKREKTKEFMETSLKGVKLAQLFFFDIFVKFKPIFEDIPDSVVEEDLRQQNKKNMNELLNAGDLSSPFERNKYVMIDNSAVLDGTKDVKGEVSDLKANVEAATEQQLQYLQEQAHIFEQRRAMQQQQALQESTSLMGEEITSFLEHNKKFWIEVNDVLGQMTQYSDALNKKIQNAE